MEIRKLSWLSESSIFCIRLNDITVHRQAILLLFVESGTRKLRKVVESRTKFPFDVERVLDFTTVLVSWIPRQHCCYNDTFAAAL